MRYIIQTMLTEYEHYCVTLFVVKKKFYPVGVGKKVLLFSVVCKSKDMKMSKKKFTPKVKLFVNHFSVVCQSKDMKMSKNI